MKNGVRVVLFSEINSKLGAPFFAPLAEHPQVDLVGVVTSPPGKLCSYFVDEPDPVDLEEQAIRRAIPVLRPEKVNSPETVASVRALAPDYFVVCNYQQIFKSDLLGVPRVTSINFHPSPLPAYAGLAPFYWMVRHGERDGAVSAIEMTLGVDAGPLLMQRRMPLTGHETTSELRAAQERLNVEMLRNLIPQMISGSFTRTPQDLTRRSYFGRPTDDDYRIDFTQDSESVRRTVRAGHRFPGAFTVRADGGRLTVLRVDAEDNRAHGVPRQEPGTLAWMRGGVFVATGTSWVEIVTVVVDGNETPATETRGILPHGAVLGLGEERRLRRFGVASVAAGE